MLNNTKKVMPTDDRRLLRKRGRNIYFLAALLLYAFYLMGIYGDGYFFFEIVWPIATILFLLAAGVLYIPAIACIERFLNEQLPKKKRYLFLLFVLIPYVLGTAFFAYLNIDYHLTSREYAAAKAKNNIAYYEEQFQQNADLLNQINDAILGGDAFDDGWRIRSIYYYAASGETVVYTYAEPVETALESVGCLNLQDKENIRELMKRLCDGRYDINLSYNRCVIRLDNYVEVLFFKYEGDDEKHSDELDKRWVVSVQTEPRPG